MAYIKPHTMSNNLNHFMHYREITLKTFTKPFRNFVVRLIVQLIVKGHLMSNISIKNAVLVAG